MYLYYPRINNMLSKGKDYASINDVCIEEETYI